MSRLLAMLLLFGSIVPATGCCCHHFGGGGYAPPPCGPCGSTYGSFPAYSQAYVAPAYTTAAIATPGMAVSATACDCGPVGAF